MECVSVHEADGNNRCQWRNSYCSALSPSKMHPFGVAVGCCRGFDLETQKACQSFQDEMDCEEGLCEWIQTDDPSFCLTIATTESPPMPTSTTSTTSTTTMASTINDTSADNDSTTSTRATTTNNENGD